MTTLRESLPLVPFWDRLRIRLLLLAAPELSNLPAKPHKVTIPKKTVKDGEGHLAAPLFQPCPNCRARLKWKIDAWYCPDCSARFPHIEGL